VILLISVSQVAGIIETNHCTQPNQKLKTLKRIEAEMRKFCWTKQNGANIVYFRAVKRENMFRA
jgi:hypothetical protein